MAAVCGRPLPRERKLDVASALRHKALPCPARVLEFVLYAEAAVRNAAAEAGFELNLNTGRDVPFHLELDASGAERHWYVIDRAILREHGRALLGPPAAEVFAPIPRALLLPALAEAVRWHAKGAAARDDDAVLNACRSLRYAEEGVWSSKPEAGAWALERVDERGLVAYALAARESGEPLGRERVADFLERVASRLDAIRT